MAEQHRLFALIIIIIGVVVPVIYSMYTDVELEIIEVEKLKISASLQKNAMDKLAESYTQMANIIVEMDKNLFK